jgi:ATP-binding cassette subfamily B protein
LLVVSGVAPLANVYITREIVDHLVAAVAARGEWRLVRPLLMWSTLAAIVLLVSQFLQSAISWIRAVQTERLRDHITARIHEQSAKVDLAFYESPAFFDHLHRARDEASFRPAALLDACGDVLQGAITLVAMAAVLTAFGPWLPLVLILSALPVLYVVGRHGLIEQRWRRETTGDERRMWYYDAVLTSAEHAAELRLFSLGGHFRTAFASLTGKLRAERLRLARRRSLAEAGAGLAGVVVTGATFGWMVWRAVLGGVTLGQFAAFYQAFSQGMTTMRSLFSGVGRLYSNGLFLENLFEFLALKPILAEPAVPIAPPRRLVNGIRFRDVTFRYPDTSRAALVRFNLYVPAGRSVAIVGANGAGKSTLIKLLCRLYDPAEGEIEIDGVDVRDFSLAELRKTITVLFQQPVRYFQSVADNIRLGDLDGRPSPAAIRHASDMAGAADLVQSLPDGYETLLGKWFDHGTELSAGEWQRIALARAFLRDAPIIILDEPTSALDPWAEGDWFERFRDASRGRTSLIVTHRLTTAMHADIIHVMADGEIVESGSHDQLLARRGRYSESWVGQTRSSPRRVQGVEVAV